MLLETSRGVVGLAVVKPGMLIRGRRPPAGEEGTAGFQRMFSSIRRLAYVTDWPCFVGLAAMDALWAKCRRKCCRGPAAIASGTLRPFLPASKGYLITQTLASEDPIAADSSMGEAWSACFPLDAAAEASGSCKGSVSGVVTLCLHAGNGEAWCHDHWLSGSPTCLFS